MGELLLKEEVYRIVGEAMEVHGQLGAGFLEAIYQEAMEMELTERQIPFEPRKDLIVEYKGRPLLKKYIADLLCFGQIVVEIKAIDQLTGVDEAQLLNYLRATGCRVGLLINFGKVGKLEWKRMIW